MVPPQLSSPLVTAEWLFQHHPAHDLRILDASFKMPGVTPSAHDDYKLKHIKDSRFFDIDAIADPTTSLPHMVPSTEEFSRAMGALGLTNKHHIVVYDRRGHLGSARAWWTLRLFGHTHVSVLNGGLMAWEAQGYPVTDQATVVHSEIYKAHYNKNLIRTRDEILLNIQTKNEQLVDARSSSRFHGDTEEPRSGLRRGHIPNSFNLDHTTLIENKSACLINDDDLRQKFITAGVSLDKPIVTSCGSGVSACTLNLALAILGCWDAAVYDGSWAEWGATQLPIVGRE